MLAIDFPVPIFFDTDGTPLDDGMLYFGAANQNPETSPVTVYWDAAGTQPAAQPIRTKNGYPSRAGSQAVVYVSTTHSMTVKNARGELVMYAPVSTDYNAIEQAVAEIDALDASLRDATDAAKGTNQVGHSSQLEYTAGAGKAINASGRVVQGADNTGVTDSTTIFRTHFDYCIPRKLKVILPGGTYLVSGAISNPALIASGELHIECIGDVTINVDPAATTFATLLSCYTTAINNATVTGGRLTINGNNRVGNGIYIRHAGGKGGTVDLGPVTVKNIKNNDGASTAENQGILVFGRYQAVTIRDPVIDTVDRTNTTGGACKGISISEIEGQCTIETPEVSRVLCTGATSDADGIAVFGYNPGGTNAIRNGSVQIVNPVLRDCQGRSIKLQTGEALIDRPRFYRQNVVSIANGSDVDSQVGGSCLVRDPFFEYKKNGATSPLGASFTPISFQQNCSDATSHQACIGGVMRTEVAFDRVGFVTVGASALDSHAEFAGLDVQSIGGLSGTVATRAVVEFNAAQVAASSNKTHIVVRDNRGNFSGVPALGYTSFGTTVAGKLSFEVTDNTNTGTIGASSRVIAAVSGSSIPEVLGFMVRDNAGFIDLFVSWTFNFSNLLPGCRFVYDIGTATDTNAPAAMAGSGLAEVEVLGLINESAGRKTIRVTVGDGSAANSVFHTQNPSAGWGAIK